MTSGHILFIPAVAIVLAGLAFNMVGEQLSDSIGGRKAVSRRRTAAASP